MTKSIENIPYSSQNGPQLLDLYLPEGKNFPTLVYFHGGGLEGGDKQGHPFIPYLASRGIAVVSANYRMYPEARYPDFVQDAARRRGPGRCGTWAPTAGTAGCL